MTFLLNPLRAMMGLVFIDSEIVGDAYEDWSRVRAPSRARRRRRNGHPQRIVIRYRANGKAVHDQTRNVIYIHPDDRRQIERLLGVQAVTPSEGDEA